MGRHSAPVPPRRAHRVRPARPPRPVRVRPARPPHVPRPAPRTAPAEPATVRLRAVRSAARRRSDLIALISLALLILALLIGLDLAGPPAPQHPRPHALGQGA